MLAELRRLPAAGGRAADGGRAGEAKGFAPVRPPALIAGLPAGFKNEFAPGFLANPVVPAPEEPLLDRRLAAEVAAAPIGARAPRAIGGRRAGATGAYRSARSICSGFGTPGRARFRGADLPSAASFLGADSVRRRIGDFFRAVSGCSRHSTSSLPIDCTSEQPSRSHSVSPMVSRASRSSPNTLTLIRPCAVSARSVSRITASLSPASPIRTSGSRSWALARSALRCAADRRGGVMGTSAASADSGSRKGLSDIPRL